MSIIEWISHTRMYVLTIGESSVAIKVQGPFHFPSAESRGFWISNICPTTGRLITGSATVTLLMLIIIFFLNYLFEIIWQRMKIFFNFPLTLIWGSFSILFIYLFLYLFFYLLIYFITSYFIYLFIYLSICYFIYLFIYSFICLFILLFIYLFIYPFIYLFIDILIYFIISFTVSRFFWRISNDRKWRISSTKGKRLDGLR